MEISYTHTNYLLSPPSELKTFPVIETEKYILKIASTNQDLESIFRLRFQVFNLELGLGFSSSSLTQMDQDQFDDVCHHLMLICKETGQTIGTYRMQTYQMAAYNLGFDAADIFNLQGIPDNILQGSVEVGRACVAKEYRQIQALLLLWQGLANYLIWSGNEYFFGCASLLTQSPSEAAYAYGYFQKNGWIHENILVYPHPKYCLNIPQICHRKYHVEIPKIIQAYLSIGAKICSLPAIDEHFKTIDFLTISHIKHFTIWH
ncbi:MAG: GNAT family N-acetyltransferase [Trichormus sp.]